MKLILKISEDGFLLFGEEMVINNQDEIPLGYIETPLPTDDNGYQLTFYKPKWNGTKWIEGATQKEIDELTKVEPSPPTQAEILEQRLADLEIMLAEILFN